MKTSIKILSCVAAALGGLASVASAHAGERDAVGVCDHVCSPGGYGGYGGGYDGYGGGYGGYGGGYGAAYGDRYDEPSRFGDDHREAYRQRLDLVSRRADDVNPRFQNGFDAGQSAPSQPRQFPRTQFERRQLERQQLEQARFGGNPAPSQAAVPGLGAAPPQGLPPRQGAAPQQGFARQNGVVPNRVAPQQTFPPQSGIPELAPRENGPSVPNDRSRVDPNVGAGNPVEGRPSPLDALREVPSDLPPGESFPQEPGNSDQQGTGLRPTAFGALGGFAGL